MAEEAVPEFAPEINNDDAFLGETFESLDNRDPGRRVRVIARAGEARNGTPRYQCLVTVQPTNESQVGRHRYLSAKSLQRGWRKVSR